MYLEPIRVGRKFRPGQTYVVRCRSEILVCKVIDFRGSGNKINSAAI
jgi:hypothetical protein